MQRIVAVLVVRLFGTQATDEGCTATSRAGMHLPANGVGETVIRGLQPLPGAATRGAIGRFGADPATCGA